ncbi:MAG: addiction module protein, partial [Thermodesulfobacteriota bacterium]
WRCIMNAEKVLEEALKLNQASRFMLIDGLLKSLDAPDPAIEAIWAAEAEQRLKAYREGRLEGVPMEEVFASK